MRRAFAQLRNGRPGPVMIEIPYDVFDEDVGETLDYEPPVSTRSGPDPADVETVARVLATAERPVIYAGDCCIILIIASASAAGSSTGT